MINVFMAGDHSARLFDSLAPIRANFLDSLRDHMAAMEALAGDAPLPDPHSALKDIQFRAHKIAGTAGTLGFAELGAAAARLEHLLIARAISDEFDEAAEDFMAEMRAALKGSGAGFRR